MATKINSPFNKGIDSIRNYKLGDTFFLYGYTDFGYCILACIAPSRMTLISLTTGLRWCDGVPFGNAGNITREQFAKLIDGSDCRTSAICIPIDLDITATVAL